MMVRHAWTTGVVAAGVVVSWLAVAGCGNRSDGAGYAAVRVSVTLAEQDLWLDGQLQELKFHVAVNVPGVEQGFVFDHEATGSWADVSGRSLLDDPYKLLIKEDGDGVMETLKVFVLAFKDGYFEAWGTLSDPDEQDFLSGTIVDRTIVLHGKDTQPPPFDWLETGCFYDRLSGGLIPSPNDMDCDGVTADEDCDDNDPEVRPGGTEVCYNEIDDDCDGLTDEVQDEDGDTFSNCDGDCDDFDDTVYPGAPERCDGIDNDCNSLCDENFDVDGDGFTHCSNGTGTFINAEGMCEGEPTVEGFDCAPSDPEVYPGAVETCDGKDNNCDGVCDEGFDQDGDGWTVCGSTTGNPDAPGCSVPNEYLEDCNDNDEFIHPQQPEVCDGVDTNCDPYDSMEGYSQPCLTWVDEGQGLLVCKRGHRTCVDDGGVGWLDCIPSTDPGLVSEPDIFCELYGDCLLADTDDPYQCVMDQVNQRQVMCHVETMTAWAYCADPPMFQLPLPVITITNCEWWIVDALASPDWFVELMVRDVNGGWISSGSYANDCNVMLSAEPIGTANWPPPMGYIQLMFVGDHGLQIDLYDVALAARQNCTTNTGMDCTFP